MRYRDARRLRVRFFRAFWQGLRVTWPILSGLLIVQAMAGLVIAWLEGWNSFDGLYFAFISGLTIGYGDLVPARAISRVMAVAIGFCGILVTGLVAALGVEALRAVSPDRPDRH